MKMSRFNESQIIGILKEAENGVLVEERCRQYDLSDATFYNWYPKYGGMDVSIIKRMKKVEEEKRRLKKMYTEERLKLEIIHEAMEKIGEAISSKRDGTASSQRARRIQTIRNSLSLTALRRGSILGVGGMTTHVVLTRSRSIYHFDCGHSHSRISGIS